MDHIFQFGKGPCACGCLQELDDIRMPDCALRAATTASNGLEDVTVSRSISNFLIGMFPDGFFVSMLCVISYLL